MWYTFIRIVIGLVIGIGLFLILKKIQIKKKCYLNFLPIVTVLILFYALYCIPIENLFVNFTSPEKAFHYLYSGDVIETIDGNSSTMILYKNNDVHSQTIIPKKNNGWKLDVFQFNVSILSKTIDRHIINVYKARDTDDYYVTVWDTFTNDIVNVSDSKGSNFQYIEEENKATLDKNVTYFAYVKDLDDNYSIIINGKSISLTN